MNIQIATLKDVSALETLLNSAYRGESSKKGWTSEADLISGEIRTSTDELTNLISTDGSVLLKYTTDQQNIIGCVNLQVQNKSIYLGMLSVAPNYQANGIGKQLLLAAEKYAETNYCNRIFMTVISVRTELINWYLRNNYVLNGEKKPFPTDHASGIPNQKLEFVVLEKIIK